MFKSAAGCMGLALATVAGSQPASLPPVDYALSFPNAVHHEAEVTATFRALPPGPLEVRMARSSPGRYAIHEFAKNVYSVSAVDGAGRTLPIRRADPYSWTVDGHDGVVRFRYTLFANHGDGTYSQINSQHAHLNIPATLAFAPVLAMRPARVSVTLPKPDWVVATQLLPATDGSWHARDLQYLMDSPIEVAPLRERRWTIPGAAAESTIRLMVHSPDKKADLDRFSELAQRVYRSHVALWGEIPRYDGGTYTFLADYQPYVTGDGMEHRNSTYLTDTASLAEGKFDQIETLSHELFHSWNVERLRPAELEPFDFTRANPTPSLWFAEGFTSYYGPLLVRRAGVRGVDSYLKNLSGILSGVLNSPGRRYGSPAEMSIRAAFADAATSIDPANRSIFTSYYGSGAIVALALDLILRQRPGGRTLDDMMRVLWRTHGRNERPFTIPDLQTALADVAGDAAFAERFFAQTVYASGYPDFPPLLAQAGLTLRPANPTRAFVGSGGIRMVDGKLRLTTYPAPGSPLYEAGLTAQDQIVAIDGKPVTGDPDWANALAKAAPGRRIALTVRTLGETRTVNLAPVADPTLEIVRDETIGKTPTAGQMAFRSDWLGSEGTMLPN